MHEFYPFKFCHELNIWQPSLHALKDWWDKSNVTWFLREGEGGKQLKKSANTRNRCQFRTQSSALVFWSPKDSGHEIESRSSLFILDNLTEYEELFILKTIMANDSSIKVIVVILLNAVDRRCPHQQQGTIMTWNLSKVELYISSCKSKIFVPF